MDIMAMKDERERCEKKIVELLNDFTEKTGCNIDQLDMNTIDVTRLTSMNLEVRYSIALRVVL